MAFNNLIVALVKMSSVWDSLVLTPQEAVLMLIMGVIQLGVHTSCMLSGSTQVLNRDAALISLLENF